MRTHRVTRIVASLLFIAALIILILGLYAAIVIGTTGLGGGWGTGSRSWLVLPILIGTVINAAILLVLGAVVYYLTAIQANLLGARKLGEQGLRPGPRPHRPVSPPPTSEITGASSMAEAATAVEAVREEEAVGAGEPEPASAEEASTEETPGESIPQPPHVEVFEEVSEVTATAGCCARAGDHAGS